MFLLLQERFYFGDNVLPLFETGIPLLKQRLQQLPDADDVRSVDYYAQKTFFQPHCGSSFTLSMIQSCYLAGSNSISR